MSEIVDTGARVYFVELRHATGTVTFATVGLSGLDVAVRSVLDAEGAPESAVTDKGAVKCEWFALCDEDAMALLPHPGFENGVPTCPKHVAWANENNGRFPE